ncbi:MAG: iron-sulfur cluster assembly accessory protein [Acidobacteria bacterium]|nr:MAG: iron-sulfur cluster assembly accessory protein [Acidobacteriota bacterium]
MLKITDLARRKVCEYIEAEGEPGLALRIAIRGRGPGGFQYEFGLVEETDRREDDKVIDAGPFKVFVDPQSAEKLEGATFDYVDAPGRAGFRIDNPNPVWDDPLAARVQEVIDRHVNPAVASHGGRVSLLDVREGKAYVRLEGGCQGCGMASVTLKQGIEAMIRQAVPEITEVIDTTDHAGGKNPYYQPAKGGGPSPF